MPLEESCPSVGASVTGVFWFTDRNGDRVNPTTVEGYVKKPDGQVVSHLLGQSDSITQAGLGVYEIAVSLDHPGNWAIGIQGAGGAQASEDLFFSVSRTPFDAQRQARLGS